MAAETIYGLVEHVELHDGDCLMKRLEAVRHPTPARLGPPDLCYLKKRKVGSGTVSALFYDEVIGYYHWRLGLAMNRGAGSILRYFQGLLEEQELLDWTSWIVPSAEFQICYFHYCTYNPFRAIDIHVQSQQVRGTSKDKDSMVFDIFAVDKNGRRSVIDRDDLQMWKEVRIAGVLRYMARQLSLDGFDPRCVPLYLNDDCITSFASSEYLPFQNIGSDAAPSTGPGKLSRNNSMLLARSASRILNAAEDLSLSKSNYVDSEPINADGPIKLTGAMSGEEAFLEYLIPFLQLGPLLGSYVRCSQATVASNLMIQIPFKYLLRQGCNNVVIDFCCRMSVEFPDLLAMEGKARRKTPLFIDPDRQQSSKSDESSQEGSEKLSQDFDDLSNSEQIQREANDKCIEAMIDQYKKTPECLEILIELAESLLEKGERAKALEYAKLAAQNYPQDFRATYCASKVHAWLNQPEFAVQFLLQTPLQVAPPCRDFIGVPFYRYATEPHHNTPNADIYRRIEEKELTALEEESDQSISIIKLSKFERAYYKVFRIISKVSGKDILVKLIKERSGKIRQLQENDRKEQTRLAKIQIQNNQERLEETRKRSQRNSSASTHSNQPASHRSTSSATPPINLGAPTGSHSSSESAPGTAEGSLSPVPSHSSNPPSSPPLSNKSENSSSEQSYEDDFQDVDIERPLPPPLNYHWDVTYDSLKNSYAALLQDLETTESIRVDNAMSIPSLVRLGIIHKRLGSHDLAIDAFDTALMLGWSFKGSREMLNIHVQAGKSRRALENANKALYHMSDRWGTGYPDWQLRAELWKLAGRKGLKHLLHLLDNLQDVNNWHGFMRRALEDAPLHSVDNSSLEP